LDSLQASGYGRMLKTHGLGKNQNSWLSLPFVTRAGRKENNKHTKKKRNVIFHLNKVLIRLLRFNGEAKIIHILFGRINNIGTQLILLGLPKILNYPNIVFI
jgi:hypothetical protein